MNTAEEYDKSVKAYRSAAAKLDKMARAIGEVNAAIQKDIDQIHFVNLPTGHGIVIGAERSGPPVDMRPWPSAGELADAVLERFEAKQIMERTYQQLPASERDSRKSPSEIKDT